MRTGRDGPVRQATDEGPCFAKRGVTQRQARYRLRIDFSVDGDIRFLGHRDMLRLFARAVVRSAFGGLAVRYTQGFNPHPRLSIPLPRPVGIASDAECLVLELTEPADEQTAWRVCRPRSREGSCSSGQGRSLASNTASR